MTAISWFGLAAMLTVAMTGGLLATLFSSVGDRKAIVVSAAVALVVQLFAFTVVRLTAERDYLVGWMMGAALRFVTLIVYGIIAVQVLRFPPPAALISLATFLFASTLLEPKFLTL